MPLLFQICVEKNMCGENLCGEKNDKYEDWWPNIKELFYFLSLTKAILVNDSTNLQEFALIYVMIMNHLPAYCLTI